MPRSKENDQRGQQPDFIACVTKTSETDLPQKDQFEEMQERLKSLHGKESMLTAAVTMRICGTATPRRGRTTCEGSPQVQCRRPSTLAPKPKSFFQLSSHCCNGTSRHPTVKGFSSSQEGQARHSAATGKSSRVLQGGSLIMDFWEGLPFARQSSMHAFQTGVSLMSSK